MPWMPLRFQPGIVKDKTHYSAGGTWWDANLVRFRSGLPEKWGGWIRVYEDLQMEGVCRSLHRFFDLTGFGWIGAGTNVRFYVISDDLYYDVTPVEDSATLDTDPITTTDTSSVINIKHVDHNKLPGDIVIVSGATSVGGIPDTDINGEHVIVGYVDADNYTIDVGTPATSDDTGGGSSVEVEYLFQAGTANQIFGGGWGSLGWGEEEWGGDPSLGSEDRLGIWSQDNWGEDLVANAQGGPIFYWDATSASSRMVNILDLPGADGHAPENSQFILVSHKDRHLLAFGASEYSTGNPAPMSVRWCSQEMITDWDESSTIGTAGSLPLSKGSRIMSAKATQQEIVVWTDQAIYSLRYIGTPYIYGADLITEFSDILGLKACTISNNSVYWWGRSGFYVYSGRVEKLPCTVWDYVSGRLDYSQSTKTFGATIRMHNEIIFLYPSIDGGGEIDSYVSMELSTGAWSIGSLSRTSWLDMDTLNFPIGTSTDGKFYQHETGSDNGETSPSSPLGAYIESAPIELSSEGSYDKGDKFMFLRRILPDITFRNYSNGVDNPKTRLVLKMMDKPGGGFTGSSSLPSSSNQVSRTAILDIEEFTEDLHVRLRGRALILRVEGDGGGTLWRMGVPRVDVRTDGQR